ncbi:hypothetical protein ACTA71_001004 [Dictyostelium dimigraforme]
MKKLPISKHQISNNGNNNGVIVTAIMIYQFFNYLSINIVWPLSIVTTIMISLISIKSFSKLKKTKTLRSTLIIIVYWYINFISGDDYNDEDNELIATDVKKIIYEHIDGNNNLFPLNSSGNTPIRKKTPSRQQQRSSPPLQQLQQLQRLQQLQQLQPRQLQQLQREQPLQQQLEQCINNRNSSSTNNNGINSINNRNGDEPTETIAATHNSSNQYFTIGIRSKNNSNNCNSSLNSLSLDTIIFKRPLDIGDIKNYYGTESYPNLVVKKERRIFNTNKYFKHQQIYLDRIHIQVISSTLKIIGVNPKNSNNPTLNRLIHEKKQKNNNNNNNNKKEKKKNYHHHHQLQIFQFILAERNCF